MHLQCLPREKHEDISFNEEAKSLIDSTLKSYEKKACDTFDLTKVKEGAYKLDVGAVLWTSS